MEKIAQALDLESEHMKKRQADEWGGAHVLQVQDKLIEFVDNSPVSTLEGSVICK